MDCVFGRSQNRVEESDSNSGGNGQYQTKIPGGIGVKGNDV